MELDLDRTNGRLAPKVRPELGQVVVVGGSPLALDEEPWQFVGSAPAGPVGRRARAGRPGSFVPGSRSGTTGGSLEEGGGSAQCPGPTRIGRRRDGASLSGSQKVPDVHQLPLAVIMVMMMMWKGPFLSGYEKERNGIVSHDDAIDSVLLPPGLFLSLSLSLPAGLLPAPNRRYISSTNNQLRFPSLRCPSGPLLNATKADDDAKDEGREACQFIMAGTKSDQGG